MPHVSSSNGWRSDEAADIARDRAGSGERRLLMITAVLVLCTTVLLVLVHPEEQPDSYFRRRALRRRTERRRHTCCSPVWAIALRDPRGHSTRCRRCGCAHRSDPGRATRAPNQQEVAAVRHVLERGGRVLAAGFLSAALLPEENLDDQSPPRLIGGVWRRARMASRGSPLAARSSCAEFGACGRWIVHHNAAFVCGNEGVVVAYHVGKGTVVWWASASPLENQDIAAQGSLDLLLNSLELQTERTSCGMVTPCGAYSYVEPVVGPHHPCPDRAADGNRGASASVPRTPQRPITAISRTGAQYSHGVRAFARRTLSRFRRERYAGHYRL